MNLIKFKNGLGNYFRYVLAIVIVACVICGVRIHNDIKEAEMKEVVAGGGWSYGQYQNIVDKKVNISIAKAYVYEYENLIYRLPINTDLDFDDAINNLVPYVGKVYQFKGVITCVNESPDINKKVAYDSAYAGILGDVTVRVGDHYVTCLGTGPCIFPGFKKGGIRTGKVATVTGFIVGKDHFADGQRYIEMVGFIDTNVIF